MKKVLLYPFNKITRGLIRFRDLLDFEITGVADFMLNIGEDAGKSIDGTVSNIIVTDDIEKALEECETLIINDCGLPMAHFEELFKENRIMEKWKKMILTASEKNKTIISTHDPEIFDYTLKEWLDKNSIKIETYTKTREEFLNDINNAANLERNFNAKLIPIFATRPCIGKFTTQMSLFRELKNSGKKAAALITEPTNFLFRQPSADEIVLAKIAYSPIEAMNYFNAVVKIEENNGAEFIIAADQSSVIDDDYIMMIVWHTLILKSFSNGYPILIVGYDDDERIRDCIDLIRIYGKAEKPFALLIPDKIEIDYGEYEIKTEIEIENRKAELKKKFGVERVELIKDMYKIKEELLKL